MPQTLFDGRSQAGFSDTRRDPKAGSTRIAHEGPLIAVAGMN